MLGIINLALGIGLLAAGRRLFWFFVAAAGFVAGVQLTLRVWNGNEVVAIIVGLIVGVLFALLAVFLRVVAIGAAGFLAGGTILLNLAAIFGLDSGALVWILYLIGGITGLVLISLLLDWALIILSSLAGASLIVPFLDFGRGLAGLVFLILVVAGIAIQGSGLRSEKKND